MAESSTFQKIISGDLDKLKFVLKMKVASFEDIKKEEESILSSLRDLMATIKELEHVLESEIGLFKKLQGGWERAYAEKRWAAIGTALREEIDSFNQEYGKTRDLYQSLQGLTKRFNTLLTLLQRMNTSNIQSRDHDLRLFEDFRQQKESLPS